MRSACQDSMRVTIIVWGKCMLHACQILNFNKDRMHSTCSR
jgi:hypothetical protein